MFENLAAAAAAAAAALYYNYCALLLLLLLPPPPPPLLLQLPLGLMNSMTQFLFFNGRDRGEEKHTKMRGIPTHILLFVLSHTRTHTHILTDTKTYTRILPIACLLACPHPNTLLLSLCLPHSSSSFPSSSY